jgi:hypothetical protein
MIITGGRIDRSPVCRTPCCAVLNPASPVLGVNADASWRSGFPGQALLDDSAQ